MLNVTFVTGKYYQKLTLALRTYVYQKLIMKECNSTDIIP